MNNCKHKWVSFEPPYEFIDCNLEGIDAIAIGAQTGVHPFMPARGVATDLIFNAKNNRVKVLVKDNLKYHREIREWP